MALFAAPALVVLACSGLVILYSQPLDNWLNRDLFVVESRTVESVPLDDQVATAQQHVGERLLARRGHATRQDLDRSTRSTFCHPDAPEYPAGGSKRHTGLHRSLHRAVFRDSAPNCPVWSGGPTNCTGCSATTGRRCNCHHLGHLIAPSARIPMQRFPSGVGNLWMELTAVWILVLLASGIYLWWPRAIEAAKPLLKIRWSKGGRIRWRDVHALTGVVIAVILICYVLSGLTWSRYWGENWRAFSSTVAPSAEIDAPSTPATMGDYDRLGRRIAWAATDDPGVRFRCPTALHRNGFRSPTSTGSPRASTWSPGYAIIPPSDSTDDGATVYGSYTVVNAWPQKLSEQRTLYLNQFTGQTITNATAAQDGALSRATSFGIAMHMGNQYGLLTRISATDRVPGGSDQRADRVTDVVETPSRRKRWVCPARPGAATRAEHPEARCRSRCPLLRSCLECVYPVFGMSLLLVLAVDALVMRRRTTRRRNRWVRRRTSRSRCRQAEDARTTK